ncbi:NAD(P)-binding protein, partial [Auricularia subglabra TFB-10046 SS5]
MHLSFKGQTVIVTGAGGGIGSAYARAYAERGANVLVNDVNQDAADRVVAEITAAGGSAVSNTSSVLNGPAIIKSALNAFGTVDVLVNNAGTVFVTLRSLEDYPDEKWHSVVDTHILGTVSCTQAVWPVFCAQGYGRIVSTTSCWALFGYHDESAYSAAKAGIIPFTKAIAEEGAPYGIKANAIAPASPPAVSASGMTNPVLPQEILRGISPDFIAPLVLALTHRDHGLDVTGRIFEVAAGWIAEVKSTPTSGLTLSADGVLDAPAVRARWNDIAPDFSTHSTHPDDSQAGLTVIVTNATSAQGRAHVQTLAALSFNVVATDTEANFDALQRLVQDMHEAGGRVIATSQAGEQAVEVALDAFGGVHAIVAGSTFSPAGTLVQISTRKWNEALTMHLRAMYDIVKACWPIFKAQKFGRIVTTASSAGIDGLERKLPLSVASGALMGFTRAVALEGQQHGIHANIVAPSAGKTVDPAIVAAVAGFLASPDVGETNGALVEVGERWAGQRRWLRSGGHSFRHDQRLTPEAVIQKWSSITDYEDGRAKYVSLFEHTLETMMANYSNVGESAQV